MKGIQKKWLLLRPWEKDETCPSCGAPKVNHLFLGDAESSRPSFGSIWCQVCLKAIRLLSEIPPGASVVSFQEAADVVPESIPADLDYIN